MRSKNTGSGVCSGWMKIISMVASLFQIHGISPAAEPVDCQNHSPTIGLALTCIGTSGSLWCTIYFTMVAPRRACQGVPVHPSPKYQGEPSVRLNILSSEEVNDSFRQRPLQGVYLKDLHTFLLNRGYVDQFNQDVLNRSWVHG